MPSSTTLQKPTLKNWNEPDFLCRSWCTEQLITCVEQNIFKHRSFRPPRGTRLRCSCATDHAGGCVMNAQLHVSGGNWQQCTWSFPLKWFAEPSLGKVKSIESCFKASAPTGIKASRPIRGARSVQLYQLLSKINFLWYALARTFSGIRLCCMSAGDHKRRSNLDSFAPHKTQTWTQQSRTSSPCPPFFCLWSARVVAATSPWCSRHLFPWQLPPRSAKQQDALRSSCSTRPSESSGSLLKNLERKNSAAYRFRFGIFGFGRSARDRRVRFFRSWFSAGDSAHPVLANPRRHGSEKRVAVLRLQTCKWRILRTSSLNSYKFVV